jgi:hypothetical protein
VHRPCLAADHQIVHEHQPREFYRSNDTYSDRPTDRPSVDDDDDVLSTSIFLSLHLFSLSLSLSLSFPLLFGGRRVPP